MSLAHRFILSLTFAVVLSFALAGLSMPELRQANLSEAAVATIVDAS
jgi:hypothetical protein